MKKLIVLFLAIMVSFPIFGQRDETVLKNPTLRLTGIWAGSTSRIHNFDANTEYAHGGHLLFELNKNFLLGWEGLDVNAYEENIGDINVSTSGILLGYAHTGHRVIHPVAYLSLGRAHSKASDFNSVKSFAGQAAVGAEINVFRWLKIGGEVGYRYISDNNSSWLKEADLSSPYAGIKLKFGWSWGK